MTKSDRLKSEILATARIGETIDKLRGFIQSGTYERGRARHLLRFNLRDALRVSQYSYSSQDKWHAVGMICEDLETE